MITAIKLRIEAVTELRSVELGHVLPTDAIEMMDPNSETMPSVLLYYGNNQFAENEAKMFVRQMTVKRLVALLFCRVADMDDLEGKVVRAVLGYCHTQNHTGMTAVNAVTARITGSVCARRIEFSTETLTSQQ